MLCIHHIGFVVPSIMEAADSFASSLQLQWDRRIFHDPIQKVQVTFMKHLVPNSPMIELVEADLQGSPISRFVKKGGGLHHLCYEVDSLEEQLQMALDCGGILIAAPQPAIAFGGNSIAWVCTRERLLVEYLQRSSNGKL